MVIGIGTDMVKISRIEASLSRLAERFAARILTPAELEGYALSARPANFLAKRFAAKEAMAKALGTGIARGVSWQHMHISHDANGAPLISLSDYAAELAAEKGATSFHLSLADESEHVLAFVVLSA